MTWFDYEVLEHNLNIIPGSTPIRQKRGGKWVIKTRQSMHKWRSCWTHTFSGKKFLLLGYQIQWQWKKHGGSWQMCIDYSDLNNDYPKDHYPLLKIDQKVESLEGFQFKCFLDVYNAIIKFMWEEKMKRKRFHTDHDTFCYQKMPCGLKNANTTYQHLMDKVFAKQIGKNIEGPIWYTSDRVRSYILANSANWTCLINICRMYKLVR